MTMHLNHITTTTGHTRRSPRDEVAGDVLPMVRKLLSRAMHGRTSIPAPEPGYQFEATSEGDALIATVFHDEKPLVLIGVARSEACALALWSTLRQSGGSTLDCPPPAPWCGVTLLAGLASHPQAGAWLGDFERCLAWAWVEGVS